MSADKQYRHALTAIFASSHNAASFVSGHDFSRAEDARIKTSGFSP